MNRRRFKEMYWIVSVCLFCLLVFGAAKNLHDWCNRHNHRADKTVMNQVAESDIRQIQSYPYEGRMVVTFPFRGPKFDRMVKWYGLNHPGLKAVSATGLVVQYQEKK